ncbi:stress response nst1 protein [Rutstroemia sp. NJR-2017a BVV2]|nr:stress response nst1 protein [Rutstroemia sp. NJR-2017a BVV2]
MPANQRKQTARSTVQPNTGNTTTLTEEHGTRTLTAPNNSTSDSSELSPTMAQTTTKPNGQTPTAPIDTNGAPPTVNRKKQKRRQKQAARLAAEQPQGSQANGAPTPGDVKRQMQELEARFRETGLDEAYDDNEHFDPTEDNAYYSDEEGDEYSGSYGHDGSSTNGYAIPSTNPSNKRSKKKKKSRGAQDDSNHSHQGTNGLSHNHVSLPLPPLQPPTNMQRGPGISKEKIWNTSSQEERERIKEFWLSLGEDERKSLVKVEKDAVLKKMKEQQKHSCSCTVCGRKRTAIEEELEVLYDAYYEELEQYANHQGGDGPPPMLPPARRFGAMSGLQPPNRLPPVFNGQQPSRGRIVEQLGDDEDEEGDEEYSEDDVDEDDYSDEEPEEIPRSHATDFFNFGNSLTVQGGILTVADDLLKNDGKKFIEMMEQLAERRMAREEDAKEQYANANYGHPPNGSMHSHSHNHNHNHPPPPEDDEYDDEEDDEDEYDSQEEDYDEEEMVCGGHCGCLACTNIEQDTMTEEQRMEEGRRMFQIFAARMFEQRVLTAYKEKVAKERQQKLLEELEEESRADSQKKAKRAKDAQKKKEKMLEKKRLLQEKREKEEAEKAAKDAALREAEEKKAEELKRKREENRKKKEAQKKAEEEERLRKEAEKRSNLLKQRERQAELERERREAKEREKKEKEELRRQAQEVKDKEAKERKLKQEEERRQQEEEKREKEAKLKAEREVKEQQQKREELAAQHAAVQAAQSAAQASKRPYQVPTPNLTHAVASPHIPVAIPAVPKAPTPIKLRTNSQQDNHATIPRTPSGKQSSISPNSVTPLPSSPGPIGPPGKTPMQHPLIQQPQATSPIHSALNGPPGIPQSPFAGMQPMSLGFQPGVPMMPPGFGRPHHDPMFPHQQSLGAQFRPVPIPNGMPPFQPGFNMHPVPQGRAFPMQHGPPGFAPQPPNGLSGIGQPFGLQKDAPPSQAHSRNQSGSFDSPSSATQAHPIARPAPIGRPASIVHGSRAGNHHSSVDDIDDVNNHLGSSALLDDSDEPILSGLGTRRSSAAPSSMNRQPFPSAPFGSMDLNTFGSPINAYNTWGAPLGPFASSSLPGSGFASGGWNTGLNTSFGHYGGPPPMRPSQPRSIAVRVAICLACKELEAMSQDKWIDIDAIKDQVDRRNPREEPVSEKELLDLCDTEGDPTNGGGTFTIRTHTNGKSQVRYESDAPPQSFRSVGAPGEIGSPLVNGASRYPGPPGLTPTTSF